MLTAVKPFVSMIYMKWLDGMLAFWPLYGISKYDNLSLDSALRTLFNIESYKKKQSNLVRLVN